MKRFTLPLLGAAMLLGGAVAGAASLASAQSTTTNTVTPAVTTNIPAVTTTTSVPNASTDANEATEPARPQGHAPLGGDGIVSSINGSTIVMGEESDEGGASYTIDASKATVTINGAAGSLSSITVGQKIFVQGTVSGTSVVATSVSVGHPGGHNEANETPSSTTSTQ
jgi:hypothetical protein